MPNIRLQLIHHHKMKNWVLQFLNTFLQFLWRLTVWFGHSLCTWLHRFQILEMPSPLRCKNPFFAVPKIPSPFLLLGLLESSGGEDARQTSCLEIRHIIDGKGDSLLSKANFHQMFRIRLSRHPPIESEDY